MPTLSASRCLILGHSHIFALQAAGDERASRAAPPDATAFHFLPVDGYTHEANARALELIERLGVFSRPGEWTIVSALGGNEHNAVGLLLHPSPFDIRLPDEPHLPFAADAYHLPYFLAEDLLAAWMKTWLELLSDLRAQFAGRLMHLEAPPPVESDDFILAHLDPMMAARAEETGRGVNPPVRRYKMWRCQSAVTRKLCDARSVEFIEAPRDVGVDGGFLDPDYCRDATHVNAAYGEFYLKRLEALMSQPPSDV